jgi:hypothetical protein
MPVLSRQLARLTLAILAMALATLSPASAAAPRSAPAKAGAVEKLGWPDLLRPEMRGRVVYSPPPVDELDLEAGNLADLQPPSLGVRNDLDGRTISIPGFVVPLEFDSAHRVTRFFLVPYFGACIHFPPPPPEQMIYVVMPKGFALKSMYDAFTLTGRIKVGGKRNATTGTANYTLLASAIAPYTP